MKERSNLKMDHGTGNISVCISYTQLLTNITQTRNDRQGPFVGVHDQTQDKFLVIPRENLQWGIITETSRCERPAYGPYVLIIP